MPRTTKEAIEKDKNLNSKSTSATKKKTAKTTTKKAATNKSTVKSTKKSSAKKTTSKATSNVSKKVTSSKKTPTTKKQAKPKQASSINVLEYYDLPYRYNETTVKILAQTPKTLFVYWDISDSDKENYIKQYGNDFFEKTKPVLIISNLTMNYTFEIEINDFANCWYFDINDEKCEYSVELGRRLKQESNNTNIEVPNNYLYITSSNKIESPNGHILFEKNQNVVFYKDVKSNKTFSKDITNIQFIKHIGKAYKMQDMYKKIYKDENLLNLNNPSSH